MIAVTGATGELGGRVARRLADAGIPQKVIVRDPARAPELRGAVRAPPANYADRDAMAKALEGVDVLYLVSAGEEERRLDTHRTAIDAALDAGVQHIVYTSFLGASPNATFTFARDHFHTEQIIRGAGVKFTFLRNSIYLDFVPGFVGEDGVIRGPAGDGRVAAVARDDSADVAVAVLEAPGDHDGRTYELTGPEALTMAEMAAKLSAATGREIRYVPETLEEARASRAPSGAPAWMIEGWVTTYAAIAAGELEKVTDAVEHLTGHPPQSLDELLASA